MKIGLIDVDNKNFPNLALMKISAYHKKKGDHVEFANMFGEYDIIYKSKVFNFNPDDEYIYNSKKIIKGGTGYNNLKLELPKEIDLIYPDYDLYVCKSAYGFLTRGCVNKCEWCVVPEKEGNIRPYMDIQDFIGNFKSAVLMDNNVLSSDHGIKQIEKIIDLKIKVDFNQGLDARLIDEPMAKLLSKVKWLKPLRLACDSQGMKKPVEKAVNLLRKYNCTPKYYFVYALIKDIDESLERILFLKNLDLVIYGQAYRDFKNKKDPDLLQIMMSRWTITRCIYNMTWEEFKNKNKIIG